MGDKFSQYRKWFAASPWNSQRRPTRCVMVGDVGVGGSHPIRLQTMTTTETLNTRATVDQVLRCAEAGAEMVRITAPSIRDARNLGVIRAELIKQGCRVPLIADIHFTPDAAMEAALHVEKVRINPGNYSDSKTFRVRGYTDEEYAGELHRLEDKFTPLVLRCQHLGRAMRIGSNHGSLSDRIMNRFGDTPRGMVESAMDYLRVAHKLGYHDIILSMKASNPKVMVQAYRLLAQRLDEEGMDTPLHLGVTEAGEGEDGRIKSAVGIAALLEDGLGDTLRVSLTEDPELEIPVARALGQRYPVKAGALWSLDGSLQALEEDWMQRHPAEGFQRQDFGACEAGPFIFGAQQPVRVLVPAPFPSEEWQKNAAWIKNYPVEHPNTDARPEIVVVDIENDAGLGGLHALAEAVPGTLVAARFQARSIALAGQAKTPLILLRFANAPLSSQTMDALRGLVMQSEGRLRSLVLELPGMPAKTLIETIEALLSAVGPGSLGRLALALRTEQASELIALGRMLASHLLRRARPLPLLLGLVSAENPEAMVLSAATGFGSLLLDGVGDAVMLEPTDQGVDPVGLAFNILQAAQVRISKTEFISCPSCGRTLFDLQEVTARIKAKTGHLKGVKIAIMGCIVNGPGEMADADFGYVGGMPGHVNLFVGRQSVKKGIPFEQAEAALVDLIKEHGKWQEPLGGTL
jgi:(E)-4-hydroxy-3-methylbut-2-enyl-diphosphate synthase